MSTLYYVKHTAKGPGVVHTDRIPLPEEVARLLRLVRERNKAFEERNLTEFIRLGHLEDMMMMTLTSMLEED